jgi:hypothetical protein
MGIKVDKHSENADWTRASFQEQLLIEEQHAATGEILKHSPGGVEHDQTSHGDWSAGGSDEGSSVEGFVEQVASFSGPNSLEANIMEYGELYEGTDLATNLELMNVNGVEEGELKNCFQNAAQEILFGDTDLTYVEGYAMSDIGLPVHHAWLVTPDGTVIDNTWTGQSEVMPGSEYYGVAFNADWLRRRAARTKVWGVFQGQSVEDWDDAVAS